MSLIASVREGRGPFWGTVKRTAKAVRSFHLPVNRFSRPLFALLYSLHVAARETWIGMVRFWWFEPLFRSQCESIGQGFCMEQLPYLTGKGRIRIGAGVRLSGKSGITFSQRLHENPEFIVGDGTFIGHGCGISVAASVVIGSNCLIAGGVSIRDYDGHPIDAAERRAGSFVGPEGVRPVRLGDDVWVGGGAQILKGVMIGNRAIVAAGSVVTNDVPHDVVVGGTPARIIKQLASPDSREASSKRVVGETAASVLDPPA